MENLIDLFYFKCQASLKGLQAKRSFEERSFFDFKGKFLRRKLEKGYCKGVNDCLTIIKKEYKKFIKQVLNEAREESSN